MRAALPDCRIYLVVAVGAASPAPHELARHLRQADVASVLLRMTGPGLVGPTQLGDLIKAVQSQDVAALIEDDGRLAAALGADGVHLSEAADDDGAMRAYASAREALGTQAIVGAAAGLSRHQAMVLGELGADYVAFGHAGAPDNGAHRLELITWWAELFEPPCIAWDVATPHEAEALATAGADFIAAPVGAMTAMADTLAWLRAATTKTGAAP